MADRLDAIERRFADWSDGGTLPGPRHSDDVTWLIAQVKILRILDQGNRTVIGERDQRVRALLGNLEGLEALVVDQRAS